MNNYSDQSVPVPTGLYERILARIKQEQRLLSLRRRLVIFAAVIMSSVVSFVFALQAARTAIWESGFAQFASLLFTDSTALVNYWQSFVLTLLEALPVMSIVACLITILIFLEALRFFVMDAKTFFKFNNNLITN
jgi:hypothetical protein